MTQYDKDLIKAVDQALEKMGFNPPRPKRTRSRSHTLPVYVMTDGTQYKQRKTMLASNKEFKEKSHLDCNFILHCYEHENWLPKIVDMSDREIIEYCKKHQ